jgi:TPR repeat protein
MLRIAGFILFSATLVQGQSPLDFARLQTEAEHGNVKAQFWVGAAYESGRDGVGQDFAQAHAWLTKSAKQGNADAENLLGKMYENGEGVSQDYVKAADWYRAACQRRPDYGGAGQGCNNLGLLYLAGRGVNQSNVEAYMFFKLSAATTNLTTVKSKMTTDEVANAERKAMQWLEAHPD